jgi:hypothetical protein
VYVFFLVNVVKKNRKKNNMVHNYQKRWVFTWNADVSGGLPNRANLIELLDDIAAKGVFQRERGLKTDRPHYQGRFELKGSRLGKKRLLEIFSEICEITNLILEPEVLYDSTKYCTKSDTREQGPWFVGADSYVQKMTPMELKLKMWQKQLIDELKLLEHSEQRCRKVIWVQDVNGGAGKSTFSKYLSFGQKEWKVKKLPLDKPDQIKMAVCKLVLKESVDMFTFDFTKTRGEETSIHDLLQVIEEIKNGHVVSVMYGNPLEVAMTSPHIIIFTNEKLKDYKHYLSDDRWQAYSLSPDGDLSAMSWNNEYKNYFFTPVDKLRKNKGPAETEPMFKGLADQEQNEASE